MSSEDEYMYDDDDALSLNSDNDDSLSDLDMEASTQNVADEFKVDTKSKPKIYDVEHSTLTEDQVKNSIKGEVDYISGMFGVDSISAIILLMHMNWNKDKLIEKFIDNPSAVNIAAGTELEPAPTESHTNDRRPATARRSTRRTASNLLPSRIKTPTPPPATFVCQVCFDEDQPASTTTLECKHQFCGSCWQSYITSKVRDDGECMIACMQDGCKITLPRPFIQEMADPETYAKFEDLIVRHYVAAQSNLKYCPHPSCTQTVSCRVTRSDLSTTVPTVSCAESDQHKFCFGCNIDEDHRPVICAVAKMWVKKCADDSETANWLKSNTKECGKCQSTIEKNGGCNHMTCKKCKYEFCWVCMGPWSEHGSSFYSCNRFDEVSGVEARDAQAKSRASLERYLHYYNRWENHQQSAKLSVQAYAKTEQKMTEMQETSSLSWIEVQFMRKALDESLRCRTTLKWTYAMAYYLEKGNQKQLFEDNQSDLEKAVEDLAELLESPIDPENVTELKQKMIDKTVYVSKRNERVLEDTAQGFLDERWFWNIQVEGFDAPSTSE